jgi:myo-inositol catabolism protein IolC
MPSQSPEEHYAATRIRLSHSTFFLLTIADRLKPACSVGRAILTPEQTAQIADAKQVIYEGFQKAVAGGVEKDKAGILVDEQFGAAILRDARAQGYHFAMAAEKSGQE